MAVPGIAGVAALQT